MPSGSGKEIKILMSILNISAISTHGLAPLAARTNAGGTHITKLGYRINVRIALERIIKYFSAHDFHKVIVTT